MTILFLNITITAPNTANEIDSCKNHNYASTSVDKEPEFISIKPVEGEQLAIPLLDLPIQVQGITACYSPSIQPISGNRPNTRQKK